MNRWQTYFEQHEEQWIELCDLDPCEDWHLVVEKENVLQDVLTEAIEALLAGSSSVFDSLLAQSLAVLDRCETERCQDLLDSAPARRLGVYLRAREYVRGLAGDTPDLLLLAESARKFVESSLPPQGETWGEVHEGWLLEGLRMSALFDRSSFLDYRALNPGDFRHDHGEAELLQRLVASNSQRASDLTAWINRLREPSFVLWNQHLAWFEWAILYFGSGTDSATWIPALNEMGA